jgi:3-deoxy-D-manno-octulosonic-acid transferase
VFQILYSLALKSFLLALKAAAPFNEKAKKFLLGRKEIFSEIENKLPDRKHKLAWFHCASLGEFEQARPVIEAFRENFPAYKIMLTFFSPSGYEIRKNYQGADCVFYLPLDSRKNASRFLDSTKPSIVFFVKYEFWYHYLNEIGNRKIPAISFSAIFRKEQLFFREFGKPYKSVLASFSRIFVQDKTSAALLQEHGLSNVELTGDTRFDRVAEIAKSKKEIPLVQKFKNNQKLVVIGSAWEKDLKVFLTVLSEYRDLKIIVAPHEITEEVLKLTEKLSKSSVRFSAANEANVADKQVLIIDNIGMLSSLYSYAEFACIGGAFGKGLHNTLEAAVYGLPLFFGTNYYKFREARDLIEIAAAYPVENPEGFRKIFDKLYSNEGLRRTVADKAAEYVRENLGSTQKIIDFTRSVIEP